MGKQTNVVGVFCFDALRECRRLCAGCEIACDVSLGFWKGALFVVRRIVRKSALLGRQVSPVGGFDDPCEGGGERDGSGWDSLIRTASDPKESRGIP